MSAVPPAQPSKPTTRSANRKQPSKTLSDKKASVPKNIVTSEGGSGDIGSSPQLAGRKRKVTAEHVDGPAAKKMADNQILEAINGIKTSVNSMNNQMKNFSTKADLSAMMGEIKDVKEAVVQNSSRIDELFHLRKEDEGRVAKTVRQLLSDGAGEEGNRGQASLAQDAQFLASRRSIRIWPVLQGTSVEPVSYTHLTLPTTPYV